VSHPAVHDRCGGSPVAGERGGCLAMRRTVLAVVPCVATAAKLMEAVSLFEADHRVLTVFTVPPDAVRRGVEEFLRARGCRVLPWRQALRREFDLVLGARELAQPHGKSLPLPADADICYDRLLASIPFRADYRRALGLPRGHRLVLVSIVDDRMTLLARLVDALPPERYRVAAVVGPEVWGEYGAWQVRAWLADCLRAGLLLVRPDEGWHAMLVAADLVVGGRDPVARYGAAIGLPVADVTRPDEPLRDQVDAAIRQGAVVERGTSVPGYAGERLRSELYRLLELAEPAWPVACLPVPLPHLVHGAVSVCPSI
jgi:hypothetical protein